MGITPPRKSIERLEAEDALVRTLESTPVIRACFLIVYDLLVADDPKLPKAEEPVIDTRKCLSDTATRYPRRLNYMVNAAFAASNLVAKLVMEDINGKGETK